MTRKADFNAEEWSTVVNGPLLAGLRVSGASRGGRLSETLAIGRVYMEARALHAENELLDDLVASPPALDVQRLQAAPDSGAEEVTRGLREAVSVLERTAGSADLDAYKRFVMTVAQAVASAHKEGGFFGIGGHQVSDAEDQALDEISAALGAPPSGATPTS